MVSLLYFELALLSQHSKQINASSHGKFRTAVVPRRVAQAALEARSKGLLDGWVATDTVFISVRTIVSQS